MDAGVLADEIADQFEACPRAIFYMLLEAINQLGGEIRIDPGQYLAMVQQKPTGIEVDTTDGHIVIRSRNA